MFTFKLQPVLRYRQWLEDEKLAVFAEKQRIFENEKAKARSLRDMQARYREAHREEAAKEDVSVTMLSFFQAYIQLLEGRIAEQDEAVEAARLVMLEAQAELIEAKKQKEIMLKLRERALELYREEEQRVEQIMLDDFSTIKHVRTQRGLNQFSH